MRNSNLMRLPRPRNIAGVLFLTLCMGLFFLREGPAAAVPALAFLGLVVMLLLRLVEHVEYVSCKKDASDIARAKCPRCGYSLARLPTPQCPECGLDTAAHLSMCEAITHRYRQRWC
jgi:hypothetical protein